MPLTKVAIPSSASRCCRLAQQFSSALSLSSPSSSLATRSGQSRAGKAANHFSTVAHHRPLSWRNNNVTTKLQSAATISGNAQDSNSSFQFRSMGTSNRKVIDAKNAKRLRIQQKKKKNANAPKKASESETASSDDDSNNPFLQHQEWVRFQQSITVDGFQTGQTTTATVLKKSRGGKQARRKREQELAEQGRGMAQTKLTAVAQKFPAIRYSPEETEALLKEAYATLPERTGKRGTRNLRRQENRWKKVRKIRSDYKAHLINAHYDRMEKRKYKRDRNKAMLEASPDQRQSDLEYQGKVLQRWMDTMYNNKNDDAINSETSA